MLVEPALDSLTLTTDGFSCLSLVLCWGNFSNQKVEKLAQKVCSDHR